jgi:Cu/Ag efflux pump CusA
LTFFRTNNELTLCLNKIELMPTPDHINRENGSRRTDVKAGLGKRDLAAVAADIEAKLAQINLPLGCHAVLIGEIVTLAFLTLPSALVGGILAAYVVAA